MSPAPPGERLMNPAWPARLRPLTLQLRRAAAGPGTGWRRSVRRGGTVEFADFRDYTAGDDLRFLDWNAYARHERLYLRQFTAEEDLEVLVALDTSASMASPAAQKWLAARQIAAALCWTALQHSDRAGLLALPGREFVRPMRGLRSMPRLEEWLATREPLGTFDPAALPAAAERLLSRPGLIILITDGYDAGGCGRVFTGLRAARHECALIHLLSREEREPALDGGAQLTDSETGARLELDGTADEVRLYQDRLREHCATIRTACLTAGARYLTADTVQPADEFLLREGRRSGLTA